MASKSRDSHGDKYLNDPIILSDSEESQDRVFEDFQAIDLEIIDDGISEDECEQILETSKVQLEVQETQPGVTTSNPLNNIKDKCVCIKVVDCDKYPWYYAKYKKQIQQRKLLKYVEYILKCHILDISKPMVHKLKKITDPLENNIREESTVTEGKRKLILNKQSNSNFSNKCVISNNTITTINHNTNMTKKTDTKCKEDLGRHKTKSDKKSTRIDFKKNQGLIGLKIKNNIGNDIAIECKTTKCKEYSSKTENKHLSKSYVKAVNKTLDYFGTIITPISDETQTNICETKKDQTIQDDKNSNPSQVLKEYYSKKVTKYKPMPKSKRIEMEKQKTTISKKIQNIVKHPNVEMEKRKMSSENYIQDDDKNSNPSQVLKECYSKKVTRYIPMPKSKRIEMEKQKMTMSKKIPNIGKHPNVEMEKQKMSSGNYIQDDDVNLNSSQVLKEYYSKKVTKCKPMPKSRRIEMEKQKSTISKKIQNIEKDPNVEMEKPKMSSGNSISSSKNIMNNDNKAKAATSPTPKSRDLSNKLYKGPNNHEMGSKISVKEVITKSLITSNVFAKSKFVDRSNINKVNPASKPCVSLETDEHNIVNLNCNKNGPSEEKTVKNKKSSVVSNTKERYVINKNEYKKIPPDYEANVSKVFRNQNIDKSSNCNENPSLKSTSSYNFASLDKPTNENQKTSKLTISSSGIVPNNSTVTSKKLREVRKASSDQEKVAASQSINSKRKQFVNILSVKNIGNMDAYMRLTGFTKASVPSNLHPQFVSTDMQQGHFQSFGNNANSVKVTQNNKKKDPPIGLSQQPISKPQQAHLPIPNVNSRNQNTQISTVAMRPVQTPYNNMSNVPRYMAGVTHPRYINRPDFMANVPLIHQPLQSIRQNMPLKQVRPIRNNVYQQPNYGLPLTLGRNQQMPKTNGNMYDKERKYMDGNNYYTPHAVYTSEICQRMISNPNRPPGICDVHPNNVSYPYPYSLPPCPLASPLPPFQDSFSRFGNSINGKRTNEFIKNINIVTPSIANEIIGKEEILRNDNAADNTAPVLSKTEMMEVLNKSLAFVSPVKADLKRPLPNEPIEVKANHCSSIGTSSKSKKLKLNDVTVAKPPRTGYSPPVLPIPTYESIFSEVQTPTHDIPTYKPPQLNHISKEFNVFNNSPIKYGKKIKTSEQGKERKSKKISLDEYKIAKNLKGKDDKNKFILGHFTNKNSCIANLNGDSKKSFNSLNKNMDTDLGYDSDSCSIVKL